MSIIIGVPSQVLELNQQGLIERAFHDGLVPNFAFRAEAMAEEWPAGTGQEIFQVRPGLIKPRVKPIVPGTDPSPQEVPYEMWKAVLDQYADSIDTHMPTAVTASGNLFLRNIHQQGIQAGQSVNRVARNELFKAYLSGQTCLTAACLTTDTALSVASLSGFTTVVAGVSKKVKPVAISSASPLTVTVSAGASKVKVSAIGFVPNDPEDPFGPGQLLLSAAIGTAFAARSTVKSAAAPRVVRSGGGDSVDALGAGDTLLLQDVINSVAFLRNANIQPHEDGYYHAHISPLAEAQVYADPTFQRLQTALPEGVMMQSGFIGHMAGVAFFMNTEAPGPLNTGDRLLTGTTAQYSPEIGAETTNDNGVDVGRVLITGKGALYERYLDESAYVTEAGITGKVGEFDVINNGINILTERIRLIIRAPMDRLQQMVSSSWSITTSFPVPSDATAPSGPELFKRAIVLEHSL